MIRKATIQDSLSFQKLIKQLGYDNPISFVEKQLNLIENNPNQLILVYEDEGKVIGILIGHFSHQMMYEGDWFTISSLIVDEDVQSKGIGKQLEEQAVLLAKERNCCVIDLASHKKREKAHQFYERQGYDSSRRHFRKSLK